MSKGLLSRLENFSATRNMSYAKIAKAMGIGNSTLSEVRNGTYKGDATAIFTKIEAFLERHSERMRRINFTADTEVKKKVFFAMDIVKNYVASNVRERILDSAKVAYIIGRAGIGKTKALQEYAKQYNATVVFITAENADTTSTILKKICRQLKLDDGQKASDMKESIKRRLKFTETLIIIDEGENLPATVIDAVRSIGDQTGVGLVIAGTEKLRNKLMGKKGAYEYLYSRAVIWLTLQDLDIKDVSLITRRFLGADEGLYDEKQLTAIIEHLNRTVRGSARMLSSILSMASTIANYPENLERTNGFITLDYIKAAITMMAIA